MMKLVDQGGYVGRIGICDECRSTVAGAFGMILKIIDKHNIEVHNSNADLLAEVEAILKGI